jgi:hypothetical protein
MVAVLLETESGSSLRDTTESEISAPITGVGFGIRPDSVEHSYTWECGIIEEATKESFAVEFLTRVWVSVGVFISNLI